MKYITALILIYISGCSEEQDQNKANDNKESSVENKDINSKAKSSSPSSYEVDEESDKRLLAIMEKSKNKIKFSADIEDAFKSEDRKELEKISRAIKEAREELLKKYQDEAKNIEATLNQIYQKIDNKEIKDKFKAKILQDKNRIDYLANEANSNKPTGDSGGSKEAAINSIRIKYQEFLQDLYLYTNLFFDIETIEQAIYFDQLMKNENINTTSYFFKEILNINTKNNNSKELFCSKAILMDPAKIKNILSTNKNIEIVKNDNLNNYGGKPDFIKCIMQYSIKNIIDKTNQKLPDGFKKIISEEEVVSGLLQLIKKKQIDKAGYRSNANELLSELIEILKSSTASNGGSESKVKTTLDSMIQQQNQSVFKKN